MSAIMIFIVTPLPEVLRIKGLTRTSMLWEKLLHSIWSAGACQLGLPAACARAPQLKVASALSYWSKGFVMWASIPLCVMGASVGNMEFPNPGYVSV